MRTKTTLGLLVLGLAGTPVLTLAQMPSIMSLGQPYFRIDGGGAFSLDQRYQEVNPGASGNIIPPGDSFSGGAAPTGAFDIGAGTQLLPYFRWDASLSYIPSIDFSGSEALAPGNPATTHVDSLLGMVTGYFDFAGVGYTILGAQPYLDAGIGAASNHLHNFDTATTGLVDGSTRTNFAWGVGAGFAVPLAPNVMIDVAYKYLDLGDAETGSNTSTAAGSTSPLKADVRTNLVMAGARFAF